MKDDEVKLGIIGVGMIGKRHLDWYRGTSSLRPLPPVPDARVIAACDINEEELGWVAKEYNIPHTFTDFRELLTMDEIVAVDVCVYNNLHAPITIAALEAGKNVYCEKPLAGSYVDAERMCLKAQEVDRLLSMQLSQTLFTKETTAAKRLIDEGYLGKLYYAKSSFYRRRGRPFVDTNHSSQFVQKEIAAGGALIDAGIYNIAQMLYLLGNPEVLTISGATHQEVAMYEERRKKSNYNVEELGIGLVRLAGGITFFIEVAWAIHLGGNRTDDSMLVGTKGGITLSPFTYHTTIADMEMNGNFDLEAAQARWMRIFPETSAYLSSQHHWVAALQNKVELIPTAQIGLKTILIIEGIYLSQQLGREVTAEEVRERSVSTALDL